MKIKVLLFRDAVSLVHSKLKLLGFVLNSPNVLDIEITSWKARAYRIFTRVGEVSEIERVSAANE